ncbi:MAG: hypothetical protein AUH43_01735 [Acidobacteria bacterium 13_1_40CM_65_14]|nr:MAG: hypothetical protein AUH43_01735 [Acidobacteria bacterium 13_1_40CM_65_14]
MTAREQEEYSALRATIRERGTTRVWVFLVGLVAWGALTVATAALASTPVAVLLPLLILAAAFEAVLALHVGVERIGRYLQVFYEDQDEDADHGLRRSVLDTREHSARGPSERERASEASGGGAPRAVNNVASASGAGVGHRASKKWEHAAMSFGRPAGAVATDALFSIPFLIAALFNFAPVLVTNPIGVELIFVGGAHALFVLRVIVARVAAARQRAIDLERFQQLKAGPR